jgi:hypothetical protein
MIRSLNQLPTSVAILDLFQQAKVKPAPGLAIVALLDWAMAELVADEAREWAQEWEGAAARVEMSDPQALKWNLTVPEIEQATTLREAGLMLLRTLADLAPYRA